MLALNLVLTSRRRYRQITIMDAVWAQKTDWIVVLPLLYIIECILSHESFAPYFDWLPPYESNILQSRGIWGKSSSPLLAGVTFAITYLHVALVTLLFRVARVVFSFLIGQTQMFYLFCRILLATVLLLSLVMASTLCGSISILLSYMIYFFKVIHVGAQVKKSNHSNQNLNYTVHLLIWAIWQWMMAINMVSLIAWQLQLPMKLHLTPDPSQITGIITPFCIFRLCISNNLVDRINENVASPIFYLCVLSLLLYGTIHLYRISMFVLIPVALLSLFTLRPRKEGK